MRKRTHDNSPLLEISSKSFPNSVQDRFEDSYSMNQNSQIFQMSEFFMDSGGATINYSMISISVGKILDSYKKIYALMIKPFRE